MEQPIITEFEFNLPIGYRDEDGTLHRHGVMRLATAADEIAPLKDFRVQSNPAYLPIIVMSRVVMKLGTLGMVSTNVIEGLFARDFNYLQHLYNKANGFDEPAGTGQGVESAVGATNSPGNVEALPLRTSFTAR